MEVNEAEILVIKQEQEKAFAYEISCLAKGKQIRRAERSVCFNRYAVGVVVYAPILFTKNYIQ